MLLSPLVRPAHESDLEILVALEQRSSAFPWSRRNLADSFASMHRCLVCCPHPEQEPAGYAVVMSVLDEASLLNICIDAQFKGRGLGRLLLQNVIEEERRAGAKSMWLEVRESNAIARQLYENLGFLQTGLRKGYYPAGSQREHACIYRLSLNSLALGQGFP